MRNLKYKIFSLIFCMAVILSLVTIPSQATENQIKNIIYMIPDGGGYGMVDFVSDFKDQGGFNSTSYPNATPVDKSPMYAKDYLAGSMKTRSYSSSVTDSAAAATVMSTGYRTTNGYVGINPSKVPKAHILEAAQKKGMSTGLVATAYYHHATPAGFAAHALDRYDSVTIAKQILHQGIDVVLTGGFYNEGDETGSFSSSDVPNDYTLITSKSQLSSVTANQKLWANLATYKLPDDYSKAATQPNLAELTQAAITSLSGNEDGFFLMVEGSKIDDYGHKNNAVAVASEYLAFDEAFKVAVEWAKTRTDTVVIGVPDHDTGGMVYDSTYKSTIYSSVSTGSAPSSGISWTGTAHTNQNVPVWMYAPEGVSLISGLNTTLGDNSTTRGNYTSLTGSYVINNYDIAPYLADLIGADLDTVSSELFVDVTTLGLGTYNSTGGYFQFNSDPDKKMYPFVDEYINADGNTVSTNGEVSLYLNGKFYAPASALVGESDYEGKNGISGSGTETDPYVMANAYDFIELTDNIAAGETYEGKYFQQTDNIDLSSYETSLYNGIASTKTFAGIYDGNGCTINAVISTTGDNCVFPRVTGTIMNLGITGSVTSTGSHTAGIARTLAPTGKIVNCYSNMTLEGNAVAGLVYNQYGKMSNCYFGGTIKAKKGINALALKHGNGKYENCYYNKALHQFGATGITAKTSAEMISGFATVLNNGRSAAATTLGVSEEDMLYWKQDDNGMPYLYVPVPTVTAVTVTPATATVSKGGTLQLSVTVTGEFNPSQEVVWEMSGDVSLSSGTTITEGGLLTVASDETATTINILAKSRQDGSQAGYCVVTVQ